jgi:nucleoside-diphosphate-sugar epimerase
MILGSGRLTVPLVYIDDVVDAIVAAVDRKLVSGEVIQLVDDERLTQEEILATVAANGRVIRIPRAAVMVAGKLSEYPLKRLGRQSPIGAYRLRSALAPMEFASDRAERLLGWKPRVGVREGIRRVTRDGPG